MKLFFVLGFTASLIAPPTFAQTAERRPQPSELPAWLAGPRPDDPGIQVCRFSAFAIKVGMDERREGLNESQSLSRWTKILLQRNESSTNTALMIGGIKLAFKIPTINYAIADEFYYDCILKTAQNP